MYVESIWIGVDLIGDVTIIELEWYLLGDVILTGDSIFTEVILVVGIVNWFKYSLFPEKYNGFDVLSCIGELYLIEECGSVISYEIFDGKVIIFFLGDKTVIVFGLETKIFFLIGTIIFFLTGTINLLLIIGSFSGGKIVGGRFIFVIFIPSYIGSVWYIVSGSTFSSFITNSSFLLSVNLKLSLIIGSIDLL